MTDKEKIVLSSIGGIVAVILGYLVWRHENQIEQTEAAQQNAANQQAAAEEESAIEQELQSIPVTAAGGGASDDPEDDGSESSITSIPNDSAIEEILQAFEPSTTTGLTPATGSTSSTTGGSTTPVAATSVGTPQSTPSTNTINESLTQTLNQSGQPARAIMSPGQAPAPVGPAPSIGFIGTPTFQTEPAETEVAP